jgi:hypothetical protein
MATARADDPDRPARVGADRWLGTTPASDAPSLPTWPTEGPTLERSFARTALAWSATGLMYGIATRVGSRYGLEPRFKIVRLESAYAYDLVGHAYLVRQMGGLAADLHGWAGYEKGRARAQGVWFSAFGSELYMETINGFMPGVRFDPLDPLANLVGALMATEGADLARRHPFLQRFSLQFGYRDWGRVFGPARDDATLGNWWHDHPNGRFGLGMDVGPRPRPWLTVFASYEITSLELARLKNRFGLGIELHPLYWLDPVLRPLPGGSVVLDVYDWLNRRILMPGLYVQLFHVDAPPFSDRQPFQE